MKERTFEENGENCIKRSFICETCLPPRSNEIFVLLGCYAAYVGSSLRTFRDSLMILRLFSFSRCYFGTPPPNILFSFHHSSIWLARLLSQRVDHRLQYPLYNHVSIYSWHSSWIVWTLKTGPTGCPETSVKKNKYMLRNNPEELQLCVLQIILLSTVYLTYRPVRRAMTFMERFWLNT